jgi:hypothetical protein
VNFISVGFGRQCVDSEVVCQEVLLIRHVEAMCSVHNAYALFCNVFHILMNAFGRRRSMQSVYRIVVRVPSICCNAPHDSVDAEESSLHLFMLKMQ